MHTPVRRFFLLPVLALTVLVGACQPTAAALPRLDDPVEIVEEALRTTAELEFIHAKVDLRVSGALDATATLEADIDLDTREFHATAEANLGIAGTQRAELLLLGTEMFTRLEGLPGVGGDARWQRTTLGAGQDPRAGVPPNPAIAVALRALLEDDSLAIQLRGIESCGSLQCYHVQATIAPDLVWRALNGGLFGTPPDAEIPPIDPAIDAVTLDLMIEEPTRRLDSIATSLTFEGTTIEVSALFSNHDVALQFIPPPPDQVDDITGDFGGLDVLERAGSGIIGGDD